MFGEEDVGKKKVEALAALTRRQADIDIVPKPEMWTGEEKLEGLVISGLDSMEARKLVWEKGVRYKANPLYIDGRMGAETALIYAVRPMDPDDVKLYESELNTDEEAPELPCTARAIIYNTFMIASHIANIYKRFAMGQEFPRETVFDFPSFTWVTREVRT
jgi:molybdopterin/thiamine biosynthesis adenylyltransferase